MKTYGLIWPNGDKELRSIVLDDEGNPRIDTLAPYPKPDDWQAPQVLPLVKIPKPEVGAWEPNVVWFDDRVERQWVEGTPAPAPTFTAAEWVEQHLTSTQLHALSDLRLSLVLAGKLLGPLMQSLRDWTSQLIVASAADPSPRSDWPPAPCTYAQASAEAIADINAP